jgi:hypothetical protein
VAASTLLKLAMTLKHMRGIRMAPGGSTKRVLLGVSLLLSWSLHALAQTAEGVLGGNVIMIFNAEGWESPGRNARVWWDKCAMPGVARVCTTRADQNSIAYIGGINSGAGPYFYRVYAANPSSPWGESFWGQNTCANSPNGGEYDSTGTYIIPVKFYRNAPYLPGVSMYNDNTNEELLDTAKTIQPGTRVRVELQIKNPASSGANVVSAFGGFYLDCNREAPFDVADFSPTASYDIGSTRTVVFYCNAPSASGTYCLSVATFASCGDGTDEKHYGPLLTDGSSWWPAFRVAANQTTGDLRILVSNAEDWGDIGSGAIVEVSNQGGALVQTQTTDDSSIVRFAGLPSAQVYSYKVTVPPVTETPWSTYHYWGEKDSIVIKAGQITTDRFVRNTPYAPDIAAYDDATNNEIRNGTVLLRTRIRVELTVKNPTYSGATACLAGARVILDRDRSPHQITGYDFDSTGAYQPYAIGELRKVAFYFTPCDTGAYYYTESVTGATGLTDGSSWGPLFAVRSEDSASPSVPVNLVASPSAWSNLSNFEVNWTNPSDPSGIAAAWYKVGSFPASATDGTRSTSKPLHVTATAEGGQHVYLWLEDGAGNKDHMARAVTMLYYDGTAPSGGTITINGGAATTASLVVTLNTLGANDAGGSGVTLMRFSNGDSTWSDWEALSTTRTEWNLAFNGGTSSTGVKIVHVQYRDSAGNSSVSYSDGISYQGSDVTAPPNPLNTIVTPTSWTNSNSFSVIWTDPEDPSGVAAAWYKRGAVPTSGTDGTRSAQRPLVVPATAEGGQMLHVWLEDGSGNKDHTNRATVQLFLDETPPSNGTISINNGSATTASPVVTLNSLGANDAGGSGLSQMRFSNDAFAWSSWISYSVTKTNWDLTVDGGGTGGGDKAVHVQYRDLAGNVSAIASDNIIFVTTAVRQWESGVPDHIALYQNFPNPFNPTTVIRFSLPSASEISLKIVDALGRVVAVLASGRMEPGSYGLQFDASGLSSGIYLCMLRVGDFVETRKLAVLR